MTEEKGTYEVAEELSISQEMLKEMANLQDKLLKIDGAIMEVTQELNFKVGTLRGREAEIKDSIATLERLAKLANIDLSALPPESATEG